MTARSSVAATDNITGNQPATTMSDLRETKPLQGKPILILGLGLFGGGLGAARFCAQQGAKVTVTDLKTEEELAPSLQQLEGLPIRYRLGHHDGIDPSKYAMVVVNPAVPKDAPILQHAEAQGAYLTSEMNLFMARCPGKVVGVTGSNGKSTTTALIAHLLQGSERRVWLGGNMGRSLLEQVHEIGEKDAVVLELSSFMLQDLHRIRISPTVAVLLNITPNHLDRHGTMEHYIDAKSAIFRYQRPREVTILNYDDARASLLQGEVPGRLALYSLKKKIQPGGWVQQGEFRIDLGKEAKRVCATSACTLPGIFNRSNALAAILAAAVMRTPLSAIEQLLPRFRGIEHRLEPCGERDGVSFYNDSVSTTPESTIASASAFPDNDIWLIAGGAEKQLAYYELAEALTEMRIAGVIGIGEIGGRIVEECQRQPQLASRQLFAVADLAQAMEQLRSHAVPGQVVLFSPATASFDQYANFEQRGAHFKDLVASWQRDEAGVAHAPGYEPQGNPFAGDSGFEQDPFAGNIAFDEDPIAGGGQEGAFTGGGPSPSGATPFIQDPMLDDPEALASEEEFEAMPSEAPADFAATMPDFAPDHAETTGWSESGGNPFGDGAPADFGGSSLFDDAYGGTQHERGGAQMSDVGLDLGGDFLAQPSHPGGGAGEGAPSDWAAQSFPEPEEANFSAWPVSPTEGQAPWSEPEAAQPWVDGPAVPSNDPVAVPDFGVWDDDGSEAWAADQWVETETGSKPGSQPGGGAAIPAGELAPTPTPDEEISRDHDPGGGLLAGSLNLIEPAEVQQSPHDPFGDGIPSAEGFFSAQPEEDTDTGGQ